MSEQGDVTNCDGREVPLLNVTAMAFVTLTFRDGAIREVPIKTRHTLFRDHLVYSCGDLESGEWTAIRTNVYDAKSVEQRFDMMMNTFATSLEEVAYHAGVSSKEILAGLTS